MSKTLNAYGTDNILKKNFYKKLVSLFFNKDIPEENFLLKIHSELKRKTDKNSDELDNVFFISPIEFFFERSTKQKMLKNFFPYENFEKAYRHAYDIIFELSKTNTILSIYNFGKIPKNINALLYKSLKKVFKKREHQKEIIDMLNNPNKTVEEISDKIYSLLKEEGLSPKEIQMKIRDINQILRVKRIRDLTSENYRSGKEKIDNFRVFLNTKAKEFLTELDIPVNSENLLKMKNIIKSFATYSLNMPLKLKIKKEFSLKNSEKLKNVVKSIKDTAKKYDIEEGIIKNSLSKIFDRDIAEKIMYGHSFFWEKGDQPVGKFTEKIPFEEIALDTDYYNLLKNFTYLFKDFTTEEVDFSSLIRLKEFSFLDETIEKLSKGEPVEETKTNIVLNSFVQYLKEFKNPSIFYFFSFSPEEDKNRLAETFEKIKLFLNKIEEGKTPIKGITAQSKIIKQIKKGMEREKDFFGEKIDNADMLEEKTAQNLIKDLKIKDAFLFPVFIETLNLLKKHSSQNIINSLEEQGILNFDVLLQMGSSYISLLLKREILFSHFSDEPTALVKDIIKYMYNYYFGFLFKEEKFFEKAPYFINSSFLKTIQKLAFKFGITEDTELIKAFKKKYALPLLSKIEKTKEYDIADMAINLQYNFYSLSPSPAYTYYTPYNIVMSKAKINKEFVKNLEEFFYINVENLSIPSYDSLVSLSREFGKEKIEEGLKETLTGIKEKVKDRNFSEELITLTQDTDVIFGSFLTKERKQLRSLAFYNFDRTKDFLLRALKEIKINPDEYNIKDIEELTDKLKISSEEFNTSETELIKKASEIVKKENIDTRVLDFILRTGKQENNNTFNFIISFHKRLGSLIELYPENETAELKGLFNDIKNYLKDRDEKALKKAIEERFLIGESSTLNSAFIKLADLLKSSINTAEVRAGFLIEDSLNDIAFEEKGYYEILSKIKNEEIKNAIMNYDPSFVKDKEIRAALEKFLYDADLKSLENIIKFDSEPIKYAAASFTDRNPLTKGYKIIIRTAKNLLRNGIKINNRESLKNLIKEHEKRYYSAEMVLKIDKHYLYEELRNRFERTFYKKEKMSPVKDTLFSKMEEIFGKYGDDIEFSTKELEKTLYKFLVLREPLNTEESLKLIMYTNIVYPKLALVQGTHDKLRSHGAFMFFTIKNDELRKLIINYNPHSLKNNLLSPDCLFSDIEIDKDQLSALKKFSDFMVNAIFEQGFKNANKELLLNGTKVRLKAKGQSFNDFEEEKGSKWKYEGMVSKGQNQYLQDFIFADEEKAEFLKPRDNVLNEKLLKNKSYYDTILDNIEGLSKEELRTFLFETMFLWGNRFALQKSYFIKETEGLFSLYEIREKMEESLKTLKKIQDKIDNLINEENYDKLTKQAIQTLKEELVSMSRQIKELEKRKKTLNSLFKEIYAKTDENDPMVVFIKERISEIDKLLEKTLKEVEEKQKEEILQKKGEISNTLKEIIGSAELLTSAVNESIGKLHSLQRKAIDLYVSKIEKEFSYKDLIFLKHMMADINLGPLNLNYFKDSTSSIAKRYFSDRTKTYFQLFSKILDKDFKNKELKQILSLYYTDQLYRSLAFSILGRSEEKYLLTASKNEVKTNSSEDLFLNLSPLSSAETRVKDVFLMPESHFLNRPNIHKGIADNTSDVYKLKFLTVAYNMKGKNYTEGKNFLNVDRLMARALNFYKFFSLLNNKRKIDKLILEKEGNRMTVKAFKGDKEIKVYLPFTSHFVLFRHIIVADSNKKGQPLSYYFDRLREEKTVVFKNVFLKTGLKEIPPANKKTVDLFFMFSKQIKDLSAKIKKEPQLFVDLLNVVKNAYDKDVQKELIEIQKIKDKIKNKQKEIKENREKYPDYILKQIQKEIETLKEGLTVLKNKKNIGKYLIDMKLPEIVATPRKMENSFKGLEDLICENTSSSIKWKEEARELIKMDGEIAKNFLVGYPLNTVLENIKNKKPFVKKENIDTTIEWVSGIKPLFKKKEPLEKEFFITSPDKALSKMIILKQGILSVSHDIEDIKRDFCFAYDINDRTVSQNNLPSKDKN